MGGVSQDQVITDERLDSLERRMDVVEHGFANDDPGSHRRYHEELIEQGKDRRALIRAVREKTVAGLVWAAMLAIGLACWKYFLTLLGR